MECKRSRSSMCRAAKAALPRTVTPARRSLFSFRLRHLAILTLICAGLAFSSTAGWSEDREELAKVLDTIPPNGPFEHYGNTILRMRSVKNKMKPVVFPHWVHRARFTCRVCHLELEFGMRRGSSRITQAKILNGKFCGACHNGTDAFSASNTLPKAQQQCHRCHMEDVAPLDEKFRKFAATLPKAPFGNGIDWAKALNDGNIKPKRFLSAKEIINPLPSKLKKPLLLETSSPRSAVTFSHEEHYAEMDCSNCHPDIFLPEKTKTVFTMSANLFGRYCGGCHMRISFPLNDCNRCHPEMSSRPSS